MKKTTIVSTLMCLSLILAGGSALAADEMMKKDDMAKDGMKKDSMAKDGMKKDAMAKKPMKKDAMKKDDMSKDSMGMGKDEMKK